MPPPMPFPERGLPEQAVLDSIQDYLNGDPYETENNFGISYVGPPHSIAAKAARTRLAISRIVDGVAMLMNTPSEI